MSLFPTEATWSGQKGLADSDIRAWPASRRRHLCGARLAYSDICAQAAHGNRANAAALRTNVAVLQDRRHTCRCFRLRQPDASRGTPFPSVVWGRRNGAAGHPSAEGPCGLLGISWRSPPVRTRSAKVTPPDPAHTAMAGALRPTPKSVPPPHCQREHTGARVPKDEYIRRCARLPADS